MLNMDAVSTDNEAINTDFLRREASVCLACARSSFRI
jgi:hypothetical protein